MLSAGWGEAVQIPPDAQCRLGVGAVPTQASVLLLFCPLYLEKKIQTQGKRQVYFTLWGICYYYSLKQLLWSQKKMIQEFSREKL